MLSSFLDFYFDPPVTLVRTSIKNVYGVLIFAPGIVLREVKAKNKRHVAHGQAKSLEFNITGKIKEKLCEAKNSFIAALIAMITGGE